MSLFNLYQNGTFAGTTDNPDALPGEDWEAIAIEVDKHLPEPIEPEPLLTITPLDPIVFMGTELFDAARKAARSKPSVAVEFQVALAAETQGNIEMLQDAIETLKGLLK